MIDLQGLDCVFFSRISPEKGADIVIEAARRLPGSRFFFYGQIDDSYSRAFLESVDSLENVEYLGVFDSVTNGPIRELNKYDLHTFPTRWPNEGVPGVLVETKMAAVPSVVSNVCYNAELVRDGIEGVVLAKNNADCLVKVIKGLSANPVELDALKKGALASSERFYIERYIDLLVADLNDGQKEALA